jgi:hypothetical protein
MKSSGRRGILLATITARGGTESLYNGQGSDLTAVGGPFRLDMRRRAGHADRF